MRLFNKLVFDDVVTQGTEAFTPAAHNALLGAAEQLMLQVDAGQTTGGGSPSLAVNLYHSGDGVTWEFYNSLGSKSLTVGGSDVDFMAYAGGAPLAAFVRLGFAITGGTGTVSAKVRVIACGHGESLPRAS